MRCSDVSCRDWPQPVLLKQLCSENRLQFTVWDPRVSSSPRIKEIIYVALMVGDIEIA